jgi:hypothetical protein
MHLHAGDQKESKKVFNMQCHVFYSQFKGGAVLCRHNIDCSFGQRVNKQIRTVHTLPIIFPPFQLQSAGTYTGPEKSKQLGILNGPTTL